MNTEKKIKCVVWDLDNTIWNGTLLENDKIEVPPRVRHVVEELDRRGILQSIASRNAAEPALAALVSHGFREYFLHPQIGWGVKSDSVAAVGKALNIGLDTVAFIDDQEFERAEVTSAHPAVRSYDAENIEALLSRSEFNPDAVTEESRQRRRMYMADIQRNEAEERFTGPKEEFLQTLGMQMKIIRARKADLERAHELTARTSQLNTTGYTYSMEELEALLNSPDHLFLLSSLSDRFGHYGIIGLGIIETKARPWVIKLLLVSCRVMSRGAGTVLLNYAVDAARKADTTAIVEFIPNDRNRMFFMTCRFAGFHEIGTNGRILQMEHRGTIPSPPRYIDLQVAEDVLEWQSLAAGRMTLTR
jgi:FkbH-like protein